MKIIFFSVLLALILVACEAAPAFQAADVQLGLRVDGADADVACSVNGNPVCGGHRAGAKASK